MALTPDELRDHVTGLLGKGDPIGKMGRMAPRRIKYASGGRDGTGDVYKVMTDTVGGMLSKLSSKDTWDKQRAQKFSLDYASDTPSDACQQATLLAHPYMPKGSRIVKMMTGEGIEDGGNHFVHHVPTTEGPYVVDFTHGQFDPNINGPIVEPLDSFNQRYAAQQRQSTREIPNRVADRLSLSTHYGDRGTVYNQNTRDAIAAEQYVPGQISRAATNPPQKVKRAKRYKGSQG
jgi:hypothetical protein